MTCSHSSYFFMRVSGGGGGGGGIRGGESEGERDIVLTNF